MKIVIGMPVLDNVKAETMVSVISMLSASPSYELHFIPAIGTTVIHSARNHIIDQAYSIGFDAIMMIDADMIFPRDTLIKMVSSGKDIVGVRYLNPVTRKPNVFKEVNGTYKKISIEKNVGLIEVGAVGAGILFVKKEVFDAIRRPCFFYDVDYGEDVNFCHRARLCGYKVYVDTDIDVGHIGKAIYK